MALDFGPIVSMATKDVHRTVAGVLHTEKLFALIVDDVKKLKKRVFCDACKLRANSGAVFQKSNHFEVLLEGLERDLLLFRAACILYVFRNNASIQCQLHVSLRA